ncbi:DUF1722 domain-containing protein [Thiothrix lacustris]|uniref:DUF1722 domain-containing protein n=1 Tax=Thiothrix lacustris TaxID=525917 RepID=A0ABY9MRV6_9GAMM|nr:DUF1722 domain-containing protein [Thiothrix lacustris]WML90951.1 DUF1722 domain-containing protein [Thiothrix lacustris]
MQPYNKIKIGISACLLGQQVRFDGGHKRDGYITGTLGLYFDFVPLCPEAGAGLGIPRPTIRLVRKDGTLRAVNVQDFSIDHTDVLESYLGSAIPQLSDVCGYILKKNSPSCGMERVKVYPFEKRNVPPDRDGVGIFARGLREAFPLLPLEEEGRLCDPVLRENFIQRVFVYHRWQQLQAAGLTPADLVGFQADHKYILMAHDQDMARELGQMVAQAGASADFPALVKAYLTLLMATLEKRVSRGQHANVLMHMMGHLKNDIDAEDRQEMLETIHQYRNGYVPLIVPITLLKHHFRRHPQPYIDRQHYLNPHPGELMLRNQL